MNSDRSAFCNFWFADETSHKWAAFGVIIKTLRREYYKKTAMGLHGSQ